MHAQVMPPRIAAWPPLGANPRLPPLNDGHASLTALGNLPHSSPSIEAQASKGVLVHSQEVKSQLNDGIHEVQALMQPFKARLTSFVCYLFHFQPASIRPACAPIACVHPQQKLFYIPQGSTSHWCPWAL